MLVEGGLKYVEGCGVVPLGEILLFLGDGGMSTAEADQEQLPWFTGTASSVAAALAWASLCGGKGSTYQTGYSYIVDGQESSFEL